MKRLAPLFCAIALSAPVFAAQNDTLITFSTKGPDTYADGSTVLDGETYALVWVKDGATFAGFLADGSVADAENSACVITVPYAKDGCCPPICFQVSAGKYEGGSFAIYLLDTRIADGEGGYKVGGRGKAINGCGEVASNFASSVAPASASGGSIAVTNVSDLPADMPKPVIKDIKMVDGYVHITVSSTVPYLKYNVLGGDTPADVDAETDSNPKTGDAAQEIIFIAPADGDSGFFRVQGKGQLD